MTNSGWGDSPAYSRATAIELVALERDAPAGPRELAVVEVADGVGREQPVALEEARRRTRSVVVRATIASR